MTKYTVEFINKKIPKKYHSMIDYETTIKMNDGLYLVEKPNQTRSYINEAPSNWAWYIKKIYEKPDFDW